MAKNISSINLARQYVDDHCNEWDERSPEYTDVQDAFLAGWAARGKADKEILESIRSYKVKHLGEEVVVTFPDDAIKQIEVLDEQD